MGIQSSSPSAKKGFEASRRHPYRISIIVLLLGGCAVASREAAVQPCPAPIPAPVLQVGDSWQWEDEKGGRGSRSLVYQTDDGMLEAQSRPGGPRFFYDHTHTLRKVFRDGVWQTEATPDLGIGIPLLRFPLENGKTWSHSYIGKSGDTGIPFTYNQTFRVVGCEQVTVPAGTFQAVVIEEDIGIAGDPRRGSGVRTRWYSPEVKFFIKLAHGRPSHPGAWDFARDWVLTFYKLAGEPARRPPAVGLTPPPQASPKPVPPSVPAPTWERGYEWKFRWSSSRGAGTYIRVVVGEETVGGVAYYIVKSRDRDIYYTKGELALRMERQAGATKTQASPPSLLFAWPLEAGKQWEANYQWEDFDRKTLENFSRFRKVENLETVTVPAGIFQAFHVTTKDTGDRLRSEFWYSPEVRWIVKEKIYFSWGVEEAELLEYKLRPTIAPK